jgi:hypothetical protein
VPTSPRLAHAGLALAALAAALWIAGHHPLASGLALAGVAAAFALQWRWPHAWLTLLPALMPVLNFAPWTGWIVVDEFDLLVLAAIAAGHARLAWHTAPARPWPRLPLAAAALLALSTVLALARGFADAPASASGWFQSYNDPLNAWRVAKSALYALALLPLLRREIEASAAVAFDRLARGVLIGLGFVACAVLDERIAYPGWLDFTRPYRTVAWFWEMHVGGAAIDAYLALATPFAAWAIWRATTPWRWALAALLALLAAYAGLTTFSRGVYLAVGVPLVWLALWLSGLHFGFEPRRWLTYVAWVVALAALLGWALTWVEDAWGMHGVMLALTLQVIAGIVWTLRTHTTRWRRSAGFALAGALVVEVVVVLGAGTFMMSRFAQSENDFGSRLAHWRTGLGLVRTPGDALLGIGLGRLPAHYAAPAAATREFSGALAWRPGPPPAAVLSGPPRSARFGGLFRLTQRVALQTRGTYVLTVEAEADRPANLAVSVCEMHLIYAFGCQRTALAFIPGGPTSLRMPLIGYPLQRGPPWAARSAVLSLAVLTPGASLRIQYVGLQGAGGTDLVTNNDFRAGLASWYPSATRYFVPWHIDNLPLEVLIERGALGLAALGLLIGVAASLPFAPRAGPYAPFLAAAVYGGVLVGLVSSVMDVPRVALLFLLILSFGLLARAGSGESQTTSPTAAP